MQTTDSRLASGTETVEARHLRDGDTIVNPQTGETIPVLMATRYGDLVMIWTKPDNGFVLSPSLLITITRRTEEIQARNLRKGDVVKGMNGNWGPVVNVSPNPTDEASVIAEFGDGAWGSWSYRLGDTIEIAARKADA